MVPCTACSCWHVHAHRPTVRWNVHPICAQRISCPPPPLPLFPQACYLVGRQPALLELPPEQLRGDCERLGALLGLPPPSIALMLSRLALPELRTVLGLTQTSIEDRLADIRESVGLPLGSSRGLDLLQMVVRYPSLLAASPGDVCMAAEALLAAYEAVGPTAFVGVLRKCPSLLTLRAADIAANYDGLSSALGVSPSVLVRMLTAQPQLLRCSPASIASKLEALTCSLFIPPQQVRVMLR